MKNKTASTTTVLNKRKLADHDDRLLFFRFSLASKIEVETHQLQSEV